MSKRRSINPLSRCAFFADIDVPLASIKPHHPRADDGWARTDSFFAACQSNPNYAFQPGRQAGRPAHGSTRRFLFAPSDSVSIFSSLLPPRRAAKAEERAPLAKETILVAASLVDYRSVQYLGTLQPLLEDKMMVPLGIFKALIFPYLPTYAQ